jgi:polynucleotide 5'-kinase involved in rRNA processing
MTPIESIYEIRSAVLDLQRYLQSRDKVVSYRAQERYEQWVDRFFRENVNVVESEKRNICLHDFDYFLKLLESTGEYYDFN